LDVELQEVTAETRPALEALWQLYRHDLSEFRDSWPDDRGMFSSTRLHDYLEQPDRLCYLIQVAEGPAGFVLVRGIAGTSRTLGEFFVLRRARRLGVARVAATMVLRRFPGEWQIAFQEQNPRAARFWRRLAGELGQDVREEVRPVPDKSHLAPDVWLTLTVAPED
jgi:predicted acetyltransferase